MLYAVVTPAAMIGLAVCAGREGGEKPKGLDQLTAIVAQMTQK